MSPVRRRQVVAIEAATGKEMWTSSLVATERGLAYWESLDRSDRRLIVAANGGLREIDARTGRLITTFGANGTWTCGWAIRGATAARAKPRPRSSKTSSSSDRDVGEGYGSPPGDIRAYDVISGKLVWTFHTIPRPGEFGYETWPEDAFEYAGGVNTWGDMTIDDEARHRVRADRLPHTRSLRRRSRR